ncbi:MAG: iron ABC transporter permease [Oligoflexia bacterium]|nr:iron ABC transporter permease [Oligoflexia bacterium]
MVNFKEIFNNKSKEENGSDDLILRQYYLLNHKKMLILASLIIIALLSIIVSIKVGSYNVSWVEIIKSILGHGSKETEIVIWNLRMPRVMASIVSGAALSLSGLIIQTVLKNPLASPSTLGISQGAAFGASLAIITFGAANLESSSFRTNDSYHFEILSVYLVSFFAFLGGLSVVIVVWGLQLLKKMTSASILLTGVALSSLFVSGTILIQYFAEETEIAAVVFWTFGDVARSTWSEIIFLSIVTLIITIYFFFKQGTLNAMGTGDEVAMNLGVNSKRFRLIGLILASLIASLTTCFHGVIAFLGLLAPHMAKRLVGNNHLFLIPTTIVIGAILLLISDTLGRIIISAGSLPVGVITSFLGAPLFLYLLLYEKGGSKNA